MANNERLLAKVDELKEKVVELREEKQEALAELRSVKRKYFALKSKMLKISSLSSIEDEEEETKPKKTVKTVKEPKKAKVSVNKPAEKKKIILKGKTVKKVKPKKIVDAEIVDDDYDD